jgi:acyl carrier protein
VNQLISPRALHGRISLWRKRRRVSPAGPDLLDAAALEAWIAGWIGRKLSLPPGDLDRQQNFADMGLDSLAAIEFSGDLEEVAGRSISPSIAWEHPTIAELARHLLSGEPDQDLDMDG